MFGDTIIALGSLVTGVVSIIVTVFLALRARAHPNLAIEEPGIRQPSEGSFPLQIRVRNRGSQAANNIRGLVFLEPHLAEVLHRTSYTLTGESYLGEHLAGDFTAQPIEARIPGAWKIGDYPFVPETPDPHVTARLMLTYQGNDEERFRASIYDYRRGFGWRKVARVGNLRLDITALEDLYRQHRQPDTLFPSFLPKEYDSRRRGLIISMGLAVIAMAVAGVEGIRIISSHPPGSSPSSTPTLSSTSSVPPGTALYTRRNYDFEVSSVAWSPDGTRLASGSQDESVQAWDALTQQHPLNLTDTDVVNAVAWSSDGTMIASGSDETPSGEHGKTVQVWNAATGSLILTYTGHTDNVNAVAWSPDGTLIASGGDDSTVQVWNARTKQTITTYTGHSDSVYSVVWSPDGKMIASGGSDKTVQVWNPKTGQPIYTYKAHKAAVGPVAWSPDGQRIASGSDDKTVQVWDATSGTNAITYSGHSGGVNALAWSPDGSRIASGSNDTTVQIWEAITRQLVYKYTGHTDEVKTVAWQPEGKLIASGSSDKTVQVWQGE